ncbi:ATP-binding protein [Niveibacterium terrae]|uniref:ATP-binding protein n=1 Tax=Niveibacterium terrae TaxID=3373598 RepID=UPI003A930049
MSRRIIVLAAAVACCTLWLADGQARAWEADASSGFVMFMLGYGWPLLTLCVLVIVWMVLANRLLKAEVARRERAEVALIDARDRALQAAEDRAAFFAALSHEIRTPMNGVIGLVDSLTHSRLAEDQRYQLGVVARSARMSLAILNNALDFARAEAGRLRLNLQPSDPLATAEDLASMFAPLAAERGLAFELAVAPDLPLLSLDSLRLRQILANFITNAIRYTEKGFVRLRIDGFALSPQRWKLVIDVEDSGHGIAPDEKSRVFRPFESLGGPGSPGTGLGLAVCRALSDVMGGQITLDSVVGQGSRFRFTLDAECLPSQSSSEPFSGIAVRCRVSDPFWRSECLAWLHSWGALVVEEGERLTLTDGAPESGGCGVILQREPGLARDRNGWVRLGALPLLPTRLRHALERALAPASESLPAADAKEEPPRRRVLVIDDEPLNLRVAKELLALLGFDAITVGESQAGFEAFCIDAFAAVLLDYRMPGEDGVSLAARMRLRERNRGLAATPIVGVTADASEVATSACLLAGMDRVMLKPMTLDALYEVLRLLGCEPEEPPEHELVEVGEEEGDSAALLAYLAGLVGSVERARGIADGFIDASLDDLSELRSGLDTRNLETVRFLAHRIKGGARSAGFERVGDAAFELENAAREGDVPACRMQTETLTRSLDRLREVLAG